MRFTSSIVMPLLAIALLPAGTVVAQNQLDHPVAYRLSYDFADAPAAAPAPAPAPIPAAAAAQQSIVAAPAPAAACGECDFSYGCAPRWTFIADALMLQRTDADNQPLYRSDFDMGGSELLTAQDLNFSVAVGPRLTAIRHGDGDWDAEISFFEVDGFFAWHEMTGTAYMVTDANGANWVVTDPGSYYSSQLYSAEFNLRRNRSGWFTFIAGLRALELDEYFRSQGTGGITDLPVLFESKTYNHLYGVQFGADAVILDRGRLTINGVVKGGIYYNSVNQQSYQNDADLIINADRAEDDHTAFLGEIGLVGVYQLTDRLNFRAGYQMMWLEGVALAPEQINSVDFNAETAAVNANGGIFYHGAVLGLEFNY